MLLQNCLVLFIFIIKISCYQIDNYDINQHINIEYTYKLESSYSNNEYGYIKDNLKLGAILAIIRVNLSVPFTLETSIDVKNNNNSVLFNTEKLLNNFYIVKLNTNNMLLLNNSSSTSIINYQLKIITSNKNLNDIQLKFKFIQQTDLNIFVNNLNSYFFQLNNSSLINDNYIYLFKFQVLISKNLFFYYKLANNNQSYIDDIFSLIKCSLLQVNRTSSSLINQQNDVEFYVNKCNLYAKYSNQLVPFYSCYSLAVYFYDNNLNLFNNLTFNVNICINLTSNKLVSVLPTIKLNINYDSDLDGGGVSNNYLVTSFNSSISIIDSNITSSALNFTFYPSNAMLYARFYNLFDFEVANVKYLSVDTIRVRLMDANSGNIFDIYVDIEIKFLKNILYLNFIQYIFKTGVIEQYEINFNDTKLINYFVNNNYILKKCLVNRLPIDLAPSNDENIFNYKYFINFVNQTRLVLFNLINSYYNNNNSYNNNNLELNCNLVSYQENLNVYFNVRFIQINRYIDTTIDNYSILSFNYYVNSLNEVKLNLKQFMFNENYDLNLYYMRSSSDFFNIDHLTGVLTVKQFNFYQFSKLVSTSTGSIIIPIDLYLINITTNVGFISRSLQFNVNLVYEKFERYLKISQCIDQYDEQLFYRNINITDNGAIDLINITCNQFYQYNMINVTNINLDGDINQFKFTNNTLKYQLNGVLNGLNLYKIQFQLIDDNITQLFSIYIQIKFQNELKFRINEVNMSINLNQIEIYTKLLDINDYLAFKLNETRATISLENNINNYFYLNPINGYLYNLVNSNININSTVLYVNLNNNKLKLNIKFFNQNFNINDSFKVSNIDTLINLNSNQYLNVFNINTQKYQINKIICLNMDQISCSNLFYIISSPFNANTSFFYINKNYYLSTNMNIMNIVINFVSIDNTYRNVNMFVSTDQANSNQLLINFMSDVYLINKTVNYVTASSGNNQFKLMFSVPIKYSKMNPKFYISNIRNLQVNSEVIGLAYNFNQIDEQIDNSNQYTLVTYLFKLDDVYLLEPNQIYSFDIKINTSAIKYDDILVDTFYVIRFTSSINEYAIKDYQQFYENQVNNGQVLVNLDDVYSKYASNPSLNVNSSIDIYYLIDDIVSIDEELKNFKQYFTLGLTQFDNSLVYLNNKLNLDRELFGSQLNFFIKKFFIAKNSQKILQIVSFEVSLM